MALTSEQRAEINRANAQKSTGPRTVEGKMASAQNALKHGLTARTFTSIPGEDPAEYHEFVQGWIDGYQPDTPGRRALVERGADVAWKLRRLSNAHDAQAARAAREAVHAYELEQNRRAESLGDLLRYENPNATLMAKPARAKSAERPRPHPSAINRELESFAQGVRWKVDRWVELHALLVEDGYWDWDAKYLAVRLLGARPEDAMVDPTIRCVFQWVRAAHLEEGEFIDDVKQATELHAERSCNTFRATELSFERIMPMEEALAKLKELARIEIERLKELYPALQARVELDRAEAPLRALAQAAPLPALQRYEHALDRTLRQTIAALDASLSDRVPALDLPPIEIPSRAPEAALPTAPAPQPEPAPQPRPSPPVTTPPKAAPGVLSPGPNEANPPAPECRPTPVTPPRNGWHPPLIGVA